MTDTASTSLLAFLPTLSNRTLRIPREGVVLPSVCLRCGAKDGHKQRTASMTYAPRWVLFGLFLGLLPYALLTMAIGVKGSFRYSVCKQCSRAEAAKTALGLSATLVGALFSILGFPGIGDSKLLIVGLPLLVAGIWALSTRFGGQSKSMDKTSITLKNCNPNVCTAVVGWITELSLLRAATGPGTEAVRPPVDLCV